VSVAERIRFADKVMNFGALQAIRPAARTLQLSGDNTTTCLVLAQGFLRNIDKSVFNKTVERGINKGFEEIKEWILKLSKPVDRDLLVKVATTSVNNDEILGAKIIEAYDKVGYDGIVEVKKDSTLSETKVISQSGMKIDKGYSSPFFINNQHKSVWEGKDVFVICLETWQVDDNILQFIMDNRFQSDGTLRPMLFYVEKEGGIKQKLLDLIEANHIDACLVVQPDGHSELLATTNLRDLALFTGGVSYQPTHTEITCGHANSVTVHVDKTIIVNSEMSEEVTTKIAELKARDKQDIYTKGRIQRLEGVSSLILVGGNSTIDIDETYDRVDDALCSVRSAVPEGYIAGGGSALLFIADKLTTEFENKDEQLGYDLIKTILQEPAKRILLNANRQGKKYLEKSHKEYGFGYNAKTDEVSNLIEDGIIDSAKSIRVALDSAKDSAIKMLLTNVIVTFPESLTEH
jgi:chaperonin GroEL